MLPQAKIYEITGSAHLTEALEVNAGAARSLSYLRISSPIDRKNLGGLRRTSAKEYRILRGLDLNARVDVKSVCIAARKGSKYGHRNN